jgi:hypothetical protein
MGKQQQTTADQQPKMEKLDKQSAEWAPNSNKEGASKGKKENVTKTTTNKISDLPAYTLTETDIKLDEVYGDHHVHLNDGTHLTGDNADDSKWKKYW